MYMNDLMVAGHNLASVIKLNKDLASMFEMSDCGELRHFLGMKIEYNHEDGQLQLSQDASIDKLITRFGMSECNPARTPMEKGLVLKREGENINQPYRELLGSLMYVMLSVRPDICYPVGYLGRFQQQPSTEHWQALKRIVRYLQGTKKLMLQFKRNPKSRALIGFVDADWASDTEDRKSISGYIFQVFGCTVAWCSKKQTTVATSSSEADIYVNTYISLLCENTTTGLWSYLSIGMHQ
ncbi:uncharacterized protein LOC134204205 [Armigeres subalbatus]|uniref:uncharacterized protein LOC134204205 n=1 Tax=Armigeres subalbatus TaxID=124917 RepID=UPI002ED6A622